MRSVVTRSLPPATREGRESELSGEYRCAMRNDNHIIGLGIVIYATLAALAAWMVRMIRRAVHGGSHGSRVTLASGHHR